MQLTINGRHLFGENDTRFRSFLVGYGHTVAAGKPPTIALSGGYVALLIAGESDLSPTPESVDLATALADVEIATPGTSMDITRDNNKGTLSLRGLNFLGIHDVYCCNQGFQLLLYGFGPFGTSMTTASGDQCFNDAFYDDSACPDTAPQYGNVERTGTGKPWWVHTCEYPGQGVSTLFCYSIARWRENFGTSKKLAVLRPFQRHSLFGQWGSCHAGLVPTVQLKVQTRQQGQTLNLLWDETIDGDFFPNQAGATYDGFAMITKGIFESIPVSELFADEWRNLLNAGGQAARMRDKLVSLIFAGRSGRTPLTLEEAAAHQTHSVYQGQDSPGLEVFVWSR